MSKRQSVQKSYLAPGDVAQLLMVSPATVRYWASKGDLSAVSTPGGHRRFLRDEIERFARDKNLEMLDRRDNRQRVLIVDDDVQVAQYLSRLLDRFGDKLDISAAHNGFDAGRLVQSFRPQVVLLDLMMPDMNGFEVCRQIKQDVTSSAIRVIAMTGFYNEENVRRALEEGAECCIEKPFDTESLLELLGVGEARPSAQLLD